jgi:alpha,alpha-trehalose-phosphate synthase [UDP-forming]/trehalose-phosphatase
MAKVLKSFIEDNFSEETLIIVSNREPYIHKKAESGMKIERPAGGLTSAMDIVLQVTGGTWVAWGGGSCDKEVVDSKNCLMVPPESPSYTLKRVWLNHHVVDNYYHGYSNQVLWPLCHIALDRVYFRRSFWKYYKEANRAFAEAVLEETSKDSVVWIHDYHLCLVPGMIREKNAELTIAHFWHIPWTDWSVFRVCPQAREILEGLLGNDLIGFQVPLFVKNFLDCVKECLDAKIDYQNSVITYKGRTTKLKAFPISIDYDYFEDKASSRRTARLIKNIKDRYGLGQRHIGIGVDRLEYTKALIKRLQALNLLFEKYKKLRGKFTFIQIAVPTRMKEPYLSYKKAVDELISKINRRYAKGDWKPIVYIDRKVEHKDLVAYYRMADLAIISSMYDGMNLVAKEYVASQVDEKGALILSELAGAADELEGALLVNPYDIEDFSDSIRNAINMSLNEKAIRMSVLQRQVVESDIYKWIYNILHEILKISSMKKQECCYVFEHLDEIKDKLTRFTKNRTPLGKLFFLFLDYDGTLSPIVELPDKAIISRETLSLIKRLKKHMPIAVISGRSMMDIRERISVKGIIYAGNHGAEIWDGKKTVINQQSLSNNHLLSEFLYKLKKELSHIYGVLIEDKGITASIHFRRMKTKNIPEFFDIFSKISENYKNSFRITPGKKVFEIRPIDAWNKGEAVEWIMENMGSRKVPIYLGDDTTDEDAYKVISGKGISICIGGSSETEYYLKNQEEVKDFLLFLLKEVK